MWDIPKETGPDGQFSEEELQAFTDTIAFEIVRRRMSVPAVMSLEMAKPVAFIGYSSMVAFGPILDLIFDPTKVEKMTCILGDRNRIEKLLVAIETLETQGPTQEGPHKEGESRGHQ
jgi:hypothetical protein